MTEDRPDGPEGSDAGLTASAQRFGFVALIGAPNAGKSTLLNALVGAKLAPVSRKVQTTRSRLVGVCAHGPAQLALVDTPGIFSPKKRLDRAMVSAAWEGAEGADLCVFLADAARAEIVEESQPILQRLAQLAQPKILVLNKVDLIRRETLLVLAARFTEILPFDQVLMISALTEDGVDHLLDTLAAAVPAGRWHYPEEQLTDLPLKLLAAELTREKILDQLHQEIPYATAVTTEQWEEREDGSLRVEQVIHVARESQRAVVLGKGGARIKQIGAEARADLEALFETRVHLFLYVKVKPDWQDRREFYTPWGLDFDA